MSQEREQHLNVACFDLFIFIILTKLRTTNILVTGDKYNLIDISVLCFSDELYLIHRI